MDWCLDLNQASSAATCDEFSWEKVETGALSHCGTLRIDCATSVRVLLQRELLHSANLGGGFSWLLIWWRATEHLIHSMEHLSALKEEQLVGG